MTWNALKNNRLISVTPPSNVQIAEANVKMHTSNATVSTHTHNHVAVRASVFLSRLTADEKNAIEQEAIKQYAAGYTQLSSWWARISTGHGIIILGQIGTIAIKNLLLENQVLTQDAINTAFSA